MARTQTRKERRLRRRLAAHRQADPHCTCNACILWAMPDEQYEQAIEAEIAASEDRIEAGQARWSETGSTRGRS
jgi:hypothetical protein